MKKLQSALLFFVTLVFFACSEAQPSKESVDAKSFQTLIEEGKGTLIDVRTPEEFDEAYIESAINVDFNNEGFIELATTVAPKDKPIYVYCLSGGRSAKAAAELRSKGYTVTELSGGITAWKDAGLPVAKAIPIKTQATIISEAEYVQMTNVSYPVLVDFHADWCAPCKRMEPILQDLEKRFAGKFKVVRINTDDHEELSSKMGIESIPAMLIYINGELKQRIIGETTSEVLESHLGLR